MPVKTEDKTEVETAGRETPLPTVPEWEAFFRKEIKAVENKLLALEQAMQNTTDPDVLDMIRESISEKKARLALAKETTKTREEKPENAHQTRSVFDGLI